MTQRIEGNGRSRRALAAASIVLVLAAITVPVFVTWHRLPDPIATHWGASGHPNGSTSRSWGVGLPIVMWVVLTAAIAMWHARIQPARYGRTGLMGGMLGLFGGIVVGVQGFSVWSNVDRASWRDARSAGWILIPALLAFVAAASAAGMWIDRRTAGPPVTPPPRPAIEVAPGDRVAWISHASNRTFAAIGFAVLIAGIVITLVHATVAGLGLIVAGLACLSLSSITVSVGEEGVRVGLGPLGWPARRITLAKISAAHAEELRPTQVGGWGVRGLPGSSALMVRGGDCVILEYRSGGRFVISVDDAAQGAALVNGLIERTQASSGTAPSGAP